MATADLIKEFYVLPAYRRGAGDLSPVRRGQSSEVDRGQTNDLLLSLMLFDCAVDITSEMILFEDAVTTRLAIPAFTFPRC